MNEGTPITKAHPSSWNIQLMVERRSEHRTRMMPDCVDNHRQAAQVTWRVRRDDWVQNCWVSGMTPRSSACLHWIGLDSAVFYVPANTVQVIWETVFAGEKTQPTVSKYWRCI